MVVTLRQVAEHWEQHARQEYPTGATRICDDLDDEFVEAGIAGGWLIDASTDGVPCITSVAA